MTASYDLGQKRLYTDQPNQNNYVTIASVVASNIPIANIFNGMPLLKDVVKGIMQTARSDPKGDASILFSMIQKNFCFKMYKAVKPKVIFSTYISRVLPDNSYSNIQTNGTYSPVIQFKIDYDSVCIGAMVLHLTSSVVNRDTWTTVNINGYTAMGQSGGILINRADVLSVQHAYKKDFIYHWIDRFSIGFANNGGNAPTWHQEIPSEIVKIWQTMLLPPNMTETIKRAIREDVFVIGHDPHRQFGDFNFQLQTPAQTTGNTNFAGSGTYPKRITQDQQVNKSYYNYNEIAMYWNDTKVEEIAYGNLQNTKDVMSMGGIQLALGDIVPSNFTYQVSYNGIANNVKTINSINIPGGMQTQWRVGTTNMSMTINGNTPTVIQQGIALMSAYWDGTNGAPAPVANDPYIQCTYDTTKVVTIYPRMLYKADSAGFGLLIICDSHATIADLDIAITDIGNNGATWNSSIQIGITVGSAARGVFVYYNMVDGAFGSLQSEDVAALAGNFYPPAGDTFAATGTGFDKLFVTHDGSPTVYALGDFVDQTIYAFGCQILKTYGCLSPLMMQANISQVNIEVKPYDQNDMMLNSIAYYGVGGKDANFYLPSTDDNMAVYRYNSSVLANGQTEENYPAIQNVDMLSIHTFRKTHGVVDFYIPLNFFFICQDIASSFPFYACAAQSILIKLDFNNPLTFIETAVSINPLAMNPLDYTKNERILVNRVDPSKILLWDTPNCKAVLFYCRYAWVPQLLGIMTQYQFYSWVTNNYERMIKIIQTSDVKSSTSYTLGQANKANFYTRIWAIFQTVETTQTMVNRGTLTDSIPISLNRFKLEPWDVMAYKLPTSSASGTQFSGNDSDDLFASQNSVYYLTPVDSIQLVTKTSINMTDEMPWRAQLLLPYLMYEHQSLHSAMLFTNILQLNIDSVFYQEGFPNCMYSPAYAPDFDIKCTTKMYQQQGFGVVLIPEYKNVSYISEHVILLKYSTNN